MKGTAAELGLWGEEQAARYLQNQGYQLVQSRFRCREGEVDLVMSREEFLCFVEVKLRKNARMAQARESVTRSKQRKLRIAAQYYLLEHPTQLQPRFDVIEIYAPQGTEGRISIEHIEDAFC